MEAPKKTTFVCGLIWRWNDEKREVEFLVIDSVSTSQRTGRASEKQTKFPGGCNRVPNEPLEVLLQREILEETYLACLPTKAVKIWEKVMPPDWETREEHTKYGFLLAFGDCCGALRAESLDDNGDRMSPPYWEATSALKYKL